MSDLDGYETGASCQTSTVAALSFESAGLAHMIEGQQVI